MTAAELFRSCSQWGGEKLPLRIKQDVAVHCHLLGLPGAAQDLDTFPRFSSSRMDMCGSSSEGNVL